MALINIVDVPEREEKAPELVDDVRAVEQSGKAGAFTVPEEDVAKTLRGVHKAARYLGFSARRRSETANEDGTVTVTFTVGEKVKRPRKPKADENSAAEDAVE